MENITCCELTFECFDSFRGYVAGPRPSQHVNKKINRPEQEEELQKSAVAAF